MYTRREFAFAAGAAALTAGSLAAREPLPKLKKAVKYGMVKTDGTIADKFALLKKLGFQGVEIDSPGAPDLKQLVAARDVTGIQIHGVIDSVHWKDTLSSPKEEVRAKGLAALRTAIGDAKAVGADTVLLVPGVVNKEVSYQECWDRSTAEVRKAIPDADKAGVKIAIEVVWNNFLTKPEQLVEYVDQFKTPTVGAYFDCSNMLKYGVPAATWIRTLGKRMLKFDFKGYSAAKAKAAGSDGAGFQVGIGEGDEDWPEVLKACAEVGYNTWATAEVKAGGEEWLADVSKRMDKILQLS
ncbi:MAG: sugar phosphate isomerase/epimerase family protein [Gemmataceae bacterium]